MTDRMGKEGDAPRVGIFLQARIGSTRLKEKVLLELGGRSVIEQAMLSLKRCSASVYLLLTDSESKEHLAGLARACGFELFVGSRDDVLSRYAGALAAHPVDYVVRATGDNPLVSSELVASLLVLHQESGADFSGYVGMPLGLGVEIVNAEALRIEDREARDSYEREHVNPYLYRRSERFRIYHPQVPAAYHLENRSVTLDTEDDYRYLVRLYADLYDGSPIEIEKIIDWLKDRPRGTVKEEPEPGREGTLHSVR